MAPTTLLTWTPDDDPAVIVDMRTTSWADLGSRYDGGSGNRPLARVFEIAEQHGVIHVLIERRYIDLDWRSEHANFYSASFTRYPSVCHRLHFFAGEVPSDLTDLSGLAGAYKGYVVLRPLTSAPVGRTMIAPPPELYDAVVCSGSETVDLLGWPFTIEAMPFISQDGQFLRCAHADMWMVSLLAHLRSGARRTLPAEIQQASLGGVVMSRQTPSDGLSVYQMLNALTQMGFSPGTTVLPQDASESIAADWRSLYAIVCRYVNSNIPPIVVGSGHVWVVVAYSRKPSRGHTRLTLYRHDDALGPYISVDDPFNEPISEHKPWNQVLLPLPPKIYLSGERAEASGRWWFSSLLATLPPTDPLKVAHDAGELSYVAYGIRSSEYKHRLKDRVGFDPDLARAYRLSSWPKHLWVIEAQDRRLRAAAKPPVLGEVILDPTSSHLEPQTPSEHGILAVHAPGTYIAHGPDHGTPRRLSPTWKPYESGVRS